MKRFLYSLIGFACFFFVSCKKFLTSDSPSKFPQEYVFGTEEDAKKTVNMVYALFNQDAFTSRLSTNLQHDTEKRAMIYKNIQ